MLTHNKKYPTQINAVVGDSINAIFDYTYTGTGSLSISGANVDATNIRLNDMRQPIVGNPNTAVGFNEWSNFYNSYFVNAVEIQITFANQSPKPIYVGSACVPNTLFGSVNWNNIRSLSANSFPNKQTLLTSKGGALDSTTIIVKCNLADLIGNYNQQTSSLNYSAKFTNDPLEIINGYFFIASSDGSLGNNADVVFFDLNMKFHTKLYQPKLLVGT